MIVSDNGTNSPQTGKPMQHGFVESFNGRLRDECPDEHLVTNLNEARQIIEEWRIHHNANRPHTLRPIEFATRPNPGQENLFVGDGKQEASLDRAPGEIESLRCTRVVAPDAT